MGELKGALIAMVLFVAIFVPGILNFWIDSLHENAFLKVTSEVSELVKEEGGVTGKVSIYIHKASSKGFLIDFKDKHGTPVTGAVGYGETIYISYSYKYKGVFQEITLNTQNKVFNMKRM
ncbi:hypothetical protein GY31_13345 [Lysinibacillus sphaericus]|uniref:hypothetical protein n=1 Tax=Lysinibacillus TaxID=400634 RepID=UPI00084B8FE4|nr:hypothetical protein [Lysinibacillus sphaericus]OEC01281.1 hypothetical protein GY31_13345 [Lysinibacillus sphaericus]